MATQTAIPANMVAKWNKHLSDLKLIMEDIELAEKAGVPEIDKLKQGCQQCTDRIVKLKQTYFPNKR